MRTKRKARRQSEYMKLKMKFYKFLNDNDALNEYLDNIKRVNGIPISLEYIVKESVNGSDLISSAFTWSNSPEGYEYWRELDIKWRVECDART